ncbi:rhodanese-related sulfurtransferase [Orbus hercynius]|uniref:Rhodanese-related sulfurtransferase n=1 Tax=Orbus hercynius TaxID=593135 RepID=A0A495RBA9_9GAMM|nr:rhodanese-like domain-containing protein [Orbus hercynius]RKS84705.1 rhodanese-related sulfurtransferase [Orbus hercynius]
MTNITIDEITSQQLLEMLNMRSKDVFLLDVREQHEVEICQLAGSVHIPMNLIPIYLDRIPDDKSIVIYCHHGVRSLNVAHYLVHNGFESDHIYSLKGGIDDWALSIDKSMNRY